MNSWDVLSRIADVLGILGAVAAGVSAWKAAGAEKAAREARDGMRAFALVSGLTEVIAVLTSLVQSERFDRLAAAREVRHAKTLLIDAMVRSPALRSAETDRIKGELTNLEADLDSSSVDEKVVRGKLRDVLDTLIGVRAVTDQKTQGAISK